MPTKCTSPGCVNWGHGYKGAKRTFSMFNYPKDTRLRNAWLQVIGRPNWVPYSGARLCEVHFSSDQFKTPYVLKPEAMPFSATTPQCCCQFLPRVGIAREHSYSKQRPSNSCEVHVDWSTALPSHLKLNCALQNQVFELQQQLKGGPPKDTFTTVLKSVENITATRKKFTPEDIRMGLQMRFSCGTTGYNTVRDLLSDTKQIPSVRLLQKSTENLKFAPGILEEIFAALEARFKELEDKRDSDVTFVFDEFAIKKRVDYDSSLKRYIGRATLPGHEHLLAEKGELFMIRGCHRKFKQVVAYHLNPRVVDMEEKKKLILDLLRKLYEAGANVVAMVCDMGNRQLLKAIGFSTLKDSLRYRIPNPINAQAPLWCLADVVHVFKALKECLCSNRFVELPAWLISQFNLPSGLVNIGHIEFLEQFQRDEDLKLVPGLTLKHLNCSHFSKMKVSSSHKVINHKVSSGLSYLVLKGVVPEEFETTAFFIKLCNRWFELTTSRSCIVALGLKNPQAYQEALEHLKLVIRVFQDIKIPGGWKPVQSHMIFTTKSLLEIQEHLINDRKYQFLMTGNFTSDCVENVVSKIRIAHPTPSGLEFKNRLKQLVISHFNKKITTSSYNHDDAEDLVDLLLKGDASECHTPQELDLSHFKWNPVINLGDIKSVSDVCYRMCGYTIVSLRKRNMLKCPGCIESLRYQGDVPHLNALFLLLTDYVPGAQFRVSDVLFRLLRLVECNLIRWAPKLQGAQCLDALIDTVVQPAVAPYFDLGTCHEVKSKIVKAFCVMRFRQLGVHKFSPSESLTAAALASKTSGSQYLANRHGSSSSSKGDSTTPRRKLKKSLKRLVTLP